MMLSEVAYPGLRLQACIVLRELIDRPCVTTDRIIDQLWGGRCDGGPISAHSLVRVLISHVRKALKPGWHVVYRNGVYRLHYEAVERMAA